MKAHDISETLQYCLEGLPEVDRAFVTVDCKSFFSRVRDGGVQGLLATPDTSSGPSGHAAMQGS